MTKVEEKSAMEVKDLYNALLDTRNLEIKLFWQRSNYFLVLNTAIAVGFFRFQGQQDRGLGMILAAMGLFSSVLWFLVCLGGKFWQARWEQRLLDFEKDHLPGLDFFGASSERIRSDVQRGLLFHDLGRLQRVAYRLVLRKPSVSYAMIRLAVLFMVGWAVLVIRGIITVSEGGLDMELAPKLLQILNQYANLLLVIVTVVLCFVTGVYAYYTKRMAAVMSKQVVAETEIFEAIITYPTVAGLRDKIAAEEEKNPYATHGVSFGLSLALRNKSSGNGSIDKPVLKLHFPNGKFDLEVKPEAKGLADDGMHRVSLEPIIPVPGGGMARVNIEYVVPLSDRIRSLFKENIAELECVLSYTDNIGRQHSRKVRLEGQESQSDAPVPPSSL